MRAEVADCVFEGCGGLAVFARFPQHGGVGEPEPGVAGVGGYGLAQAAGEVRVRAHEANLGQQREGLAVTRGRREHGGELTFGLVEAGQLHQRTRPVEVQLTAAQAGGGGAVEFRQRLRGSVHA